jgi:uncharacterized membrane protein
MEGLWPFLLFLLVSIEIWDLFSQRLMTAGPGTPSERLRYLRLMALGAGWIALSLPLAWGGLRTRILPLLIAGLMILAGGLLLCAMNGLSFDPIELFVPLANARAAVLAFAALAGVVHLRMMRGEGGRPEWLGTMGDILRVAVPLLLLELATTEAWDHFRRMELSVEQGSAASERLMNLQQLSFSGIWLLFSIGLMLFGLWRRSKTWRIMAIVLFGVAILKIFIYDLSFLDTLYRFVSFGVLGVILLATSYLYTRYKPFIAGTAGPTKPSDHEGRTS